jgi:hypothetical protein
MNNASALLRTLITYAICVPLAVVVGSLVCSAANLSSRATLVEAGLFILALCLPILLRWHHPLLIFCWNLPMTVFFLPGQPDVWLPMMALSLGISVLQRALNQNMRFLSAPQITWPLIWLAAVTLFTAEMTGGIGLHSMGNEVSGGKRYILVLAAIAGFYALSARRIPPRRAWLYIALFFLPGCVGVIGDLYSFVPRNLNFIFLFFPANAYAFSSNPMEEVSRFNGLRILGGSIVPFMLARYGIRGIFLSGRPLRLLLFVAFVFVSWFGGFRSGVITFVLGFSIQFYLEGLYRTKLVPLFAFAGIVAAVICVPLVDKLPYSIQRSLAFLPINVSLAAKGDAEASTEWRLQIWKAVLPEVPSHLLLGKGYALDASYFQATSSAFKPISAEDWGLTMSSDYHSGPLSVILPLGIWGAIAFGWLLIAGMRALSANYRYGDPALRTVNTFLLAVFLTKTLIFLFIVGGFYGDLMTFTGYLGLSVSLNGGICRRPAPAPVSHTAETGASPLMRPRLLPAFSK